MWNEDEHKRIGNRKNVEKGLAKREMALNQNQSSCLPNQSLPFEMKASVPIEVVVVGLQEEEWIESPLLARMIATWIVMGLQDVEVIEWTIDWDHHEWTIEQVIAEGKIVDMMIEGITDKTTE
jgi:hypothetical protein